MSIELKSVSYTYAPNTHYETRALDHINLKIHDGEFLGIMGKTGCGKSTLIQMMDGLLKPDTGVVLLDGEDINKKRYDLGILRKKVGIVFQFSEYQLFETTVERDVAFVLKNLGLGKGEIRDRVAKALEAVGFDYDKVKNKSPLGFSGGEKRRLAIAGVLAAKPEYLILDEPIAGLDPLGRVSFLKLVERLNKDGASIIMISHDSDVLAEYASRIILMDNGRILRDDKPENVLSDCEALEKIGVGTGQLASIGNMLRHKGVDISQKAVKYNQLLAEISRLYGGDRL